MHGRKHIPVCLIVPMSAHRYAMDFGFLFDSDPIVFKAEPATVNTVRVRPRYSRNRRQRGLTIGDQTNATLQRTSAVYGRPPILADIGRTKRQVEVETYVVLADNEVLG